MVSKVKQHLTACPEKQNQEVLLALPRYSAGFGRGLGDGDNEKGTCVSVSHRKIFLG